jgi:MarR family multiple antibiotic resistance transcriptional regulator
MQDSLTDDQDYKLLWLLFRTRDAIWRAREKEVRPLNIRGREAAVLFVIQNINAVATPSEISRWLFRQPHTASGLLRRMEQKGLVKMVKDLDRKNLIRVAITRKGKRVYEKASKRDVIHSIMSVLSERERKLLGSCLDKLLEKAISELGVAKPPLL